MSATNYTLECEQGATFRCVLTWKDQAGEEVNNAGYTARMQVRKDYGITPVIELDSDNGIELGGGDGTVTLTIPASETSDLMAGDYFYDLEMTDEDGVVSRILEGVFSVKRQITI